MLRRLRSHKGYWGAMRKAKPHEVGLLSSVAEPEPVGAGTFWSEPEPEPEPV